MAVGEFPASPGLRGAHGRRFGHRPARPGLALAAGGQRGRLVPGGAVPRRAGQGPSLRAALGAQAGAQGSAQGGAQGGAQGVRPVRGRRRGQVPERGGDRQRFVLVQSTWSSLRGGGISLTQAEEINRREVWAAGRALGWFDLFLQIYLFLQGIISENVEIPPHLLHRLEEITQELRALQPGSEHPRFLFLRENMSLQQL